MNKRKRCPMCDKLFDPRGIKRHTNWCVKQHYPGKTYPESNGVLVPDDTPEDVKKLARHALMYGANLAPEGAQWTIKVNLREGTVTMQGGTSGEHNDTG